MMQVGSLLPNDLGLFDMLGNAREWCLNQYQVYSGGTREQPSDDREDETDQVSAHAPRVLRGGTFTDRHEYVRCADRSRSSPGEAQTANGFRPARTFP